MITKIFPDKISLAQSAAEEGGGIIRRAIAERGQARIIAATGNSQLEFLKALTTATEVEWPRVEVFHLDEYLNLSIEHPASFRKYLLERLIKPTGIKNYHLLDGESDPKTVIAQTGAALNSAPIDVAFVGIGENGHLAFNDPPADFETEAPYLIVELDEACRQQQVGEGWFTKIEEVPQQAISMSVRQILRAEEIICVVPDKRKAEAVKACLEGPVNRLAPASILRTHPRATIYLDHESSSLLARSTADLE